MADHSASDSADLAEFGYRQRLNRTLGGFSSFAAAFSFISILTGMFQLFGFGYGFGGPSIFWAWMLVFAGQFAVALNFAELGARYPIAGSIYTWSKQISGKALAWLAGWTMMIAAIVTLAAVAIALQIVLPAIWSRFQIFENNTQNAVFIGCCLLVLTTLINVIGVRLTAVINNIGVIAELVGAVLLIVLLLVNAVRGPGVVFGGPDVSAAVGADPGAGLGTAFLLALVMPAWVMFGFDTASSLAEETRDPRRKTPIAILQSIGAAGIAGALLLLFALMAAPTLGLSELGAGGLPLIVESALGPALGKTLLVVVAIAICVCALAIHTAAIRMMFAMARDNNLPFGSKIAHVSEQHKAPTVPAIVAGIAAALILVVNIGVPQIFTVVTSVAIVVVYIAYLLVTVPLLLRRLNGWPADGGRTGLFSLGKAGIVINVLAVLYGALLAFNIIWPREEIYGEGGYAWGGVIFVAAAIGLGLVYYLLVQRHRTGVLDEHRADAGEPALE